VPTDIAAPAVDESTSSEAVEKKKVDLLRHVLFSVDPKSVACRHAEGLPVVSNHEIL